MFLIFLGYPRTFWTSRSKRGSRRPGKCLITLSPSVFPCTQTPHFFVYLFPTTYPIPSFSVLANSSVVRDGKDLARVLGARRKDKVRPLESQREPWIYQGECRTQPGVDFGREGRKEGQGWVWDRVRCNRRSWSGGRSRREADGVRTEPTALGESLGTDRPQGGPAVLDCEGRE